MAHLISVKRSSPSASNHLLMADNASSDKFINAFNKQRGTLAGFAKCVNEAELHIVRDGFYLGMATELRLTDVTMRRTIVTNDDVADSAFTKESFQQIVTCARSSAGWNDMVDAVKSFAAEVGSDLDSIWMGLERGRLEWLAACRGAHYIKTTLKAGLERDSDATEGDVSDAKMIWIYALATSIPALQDAASVWQGVVELKDRTKPLVGYNETLWDCRKPEWEPLDLGVQAAAERGGSSIDEAWKL